MAQAIAIGVPHGIASGRWQTVPAKLLIFKDLQNEGAWRQNSQCFIFVSF
jgi:hypothetical protein